MAVFLCQKIKFQFDDEVNPHLSYYSGEYLLKVQQGIFEPQLIYEENKPLFSRLEKNSTVTPATIRYCPEIRGWALSINKMKPCEKSERLAKTSEVSSDKRFDILKISADSWSVRSVLSFGHNRRVQLKEFYRLCLDKDDPEPKNANCVEITNDDPVNQFAGTIRWSQRYTIYSNYSFINDKPVYWNVNGTKDQAVIFLGKRWTIVSVNFTDKNDVANFHGRWSDYEVGFFSKPIRLDSPIDKGTPTYLKWMKVRKESRNNNTDYRFPDENREVNWEFLCHYYNKTFHPCHHNGRCVGNDPNKMSCKCENGATGRLCQRAPLGDGNCDKYFNTPFYAYDGSDFFKESCKSRTHICGRDESKKFYVGYDNCISFCTERTNEVFSDELCHSMSSLQLPYDQSVGAFVNKNDELIVFDRRHCMEGKRNRN